MMKVKVRYFGHVMWRTDYLERPWCWERLKAGGEGNNRGWDGWMVSPTQWTWVWVNSGSWWWTGRPGVLRFMGVAKSGTQLTQLNWTVFISHKAEYNSTLRLEFEWCSEGVDKEWQLAWGDKDGFEKRWVYQREGKSFQAKAEGTWWMASANFSLQLKSRPLLKCTR